MSHWALSSSEDEDDKSLLPASKKTFPSPAQHKARKLIKTTPKAGKLPSPSKRSDVNKTRKSFNSPVIVIDDDSPEKPSKKPDLSKVRKLTKTPVIVIDDDSPEKPSLKKNSQVGVLATSPLKKNSPDKLKLKTTSLPVCSYGSNCYRKNPEHFKEYSHPPKRPTAGSSQSRSPPKRPTASSSQSGSPNKKIKLADKSRSSANVNDRRDPQHVIESSSPHNFLLTTVAGISQQYNHKGVQPTQDEQQFIPNSLALRDLLSERMGELHKSAQFNYCIDVEWMMMQYPAKYRQLPLLLVHGDKNAQEKSLHDQCKPYPNIEPCRAELPIPFGTHHTKMMFLKYKCGLRIVITTANLVMQDWFQKTQGMWVSPLLPPTQSNNRSPTNFKEDLVAYLVAYKQKQLHPWIEIINQHDFSAVNVALVASVPGSHDAGPAKWGHLKLRKLLKEHAIRTDPSWPVVAQFSSIGSLGKDKDAWLCSELLNTLSSCKGVSGLRKFPLCKLIFPSVDDVRCSLEGYPAGGSIPYSTATAAKQPWLPKLMHRWKADHCGRTQASPHIKTYFRVSPYDTNLRAPWFLMASHNLSKSAWGSLNKANTRLSVRSYELGVLFLPKFVLGGNSNHFRLSTGGDDGGFPLPVKMPLVPYSRDDEPWIWDAKHVDAPDRNGNMWVPQL